MNIIDINKEHEAVLKKFITPKDSWTPVEKALYTPKNFFYDYKKNQELLFQAIKYSFKHHFENNVLYKQLCKVNNVTADLIKTNDDLHKIPLVSDTFFKDYPDEKDFIKWLDTIYTGDLPKPKMSTSAPSHDDVIAEMNELNRTSERP